MNLLSSLGTGAGILSDVFNVGSDIWKTNKQLDLQKEAWNREDTAVQRRVNDLKAAGLSPVLAAGSAASSSGPINVSAPKASLGNVYTSAQMESMRKQNAVTDAQLDLVNAQIDKTDADSFVSRMVRDTLRKDASVNGRRSHDLIGSTIDSAIAANKKVVRDQEEFDRNTNLAREYGVISSSAQAMDTVSAGAMIENMLSGKRFNAGPLASVLINAFRRIR